VNGERNREGGKSDSRQEGCERRESARSGGGQCHRHDFFRCVLGSCRLRNRWRPRGVVWTGAVNWNWRFVVVKWKHQSQLFTICRDPIEHWPITAETSNNPDRRSIPERQRRLPLFRVSPSTPPIDGHTDRQLPYTLQPSPSRPVFPARSFLRHIHTASTHSQSFSSFTHLSPCTNTHHHVYPGCTSFGLPQKPRRFRQHYLSDRA
jgi:hypothetical protein